MERADALLMAAALSLIAPADLAQTPAKPAPAPAAKAPAAKAAAPAAAPDLTAAIEKANQGDPAPLFKLADAGRADAQFFAAGVLIFGLKDIKTDPARGCAYAEKASVTRGDAAHLLGECYRRGLAGKLDKAKAEAAYTHAIQLGYARSKCVLGEMLFADASQAPRGLTLCKEAAQAGDPQAMFKVADFYYRGNGAVKADKAQARKWYEEAARQNQPGAARRLGEMYAKGEGGKADSKKAMEWWTKAEKAGDPMVAILVGDHLFGQMTGGKSPGPGQYAFKGGVPLADIEVVEDWYKQAEARDPRPDVKKRAASALSTLAYLKKAGEVKTTTSSSAKSKPSSSKPAKPPPPPPPPPPKATNAPPKP